MPRANEPRERRLVSEWTRVQFPSGHVKEIVRLGPVLSSLGDARLSENELRAMGVYRRWVDALVVDGGVVHLIEGKIRNTPGAIEQLELYERLIPLTPELQDLWKLPIQKHLVWVIDDPVVESMARERGIRVHVFRPPWAVEYLSTFASRKTAALARGAPIAAADEGEE